MSHEKSDANGRSVFEFYFLLFAGVGLALGLSALLLHGAIQPHIAAPMMPSPALQVTPEADLAAHRAGDQALANVYGWVDHDKGIVRIPIAQAMQRMVERGLDGTNAAVRR